MVTFLPFGQPYSVASGFYSAEPEEAPPHKLTVTKVLASWDFMASKRHPSPPRNPTAAEVLSYARENCSSGLSFVSLCQKSQGKAQHQRQSLLRLQYDDHPWIDAQDEQGVSTNAGTLECSPSASPSGSDAALTTPSLGLPGTSHSPGARRPSFTPESGGPFVAACSGLTQPHRHCFSTPQLPEECEVAPGGARAAARPSRLQVDVDVEAEFDTEGNDINTEGDGDGDEGDEEGWAIASAPIITLPSEDTPWGQPRAGLLSAPRGTARACSTRTSGLLAMLSELDADDGHIATSPRGGAGPSRSCSGFSATAASPRARRATPLSAQDRGGPRRSFLRDLVGGASPSLPPPPAVPHTPVTTGRRTFLESSRVAAGESYSSMSAGSVHRGAAVDSGTYFGGGGGCGRLHNIMDSGSLAEGFKSRYAASVTGSTDLGAAADTDGTPYACTREWRATWTGLHRTSSTSHCPSSPMTGSISTALRPRNATALGCSSGGWVSPQGSSSHELRPTGRPVGPALMAGSPAAGSAPTTPSAPLHFTDAGSGLRLSRNLSSCTGKGRELELLHVTSARPPWRASQKDQPPSPKLQKRPVVWEVRSISLSGRRPGLGLRPPLSGEGTGSGSGGGAGASAAGALVSGSFLAHRGSASGDARPQRSVSGLGSLSLGGGSRRVSSAAVPLSPQDSAALQGSRGAT